MPVRDVSNWRGNIIGAVPSRKLGGRMVHYESLVERAYIYVLEYDMHVLRYEEQPCTIRYHFEERVCHYTPDFSVTWSTDSPSIVECKPQVFVSDSNNGPKWTAAQLWCEANGYEFVLVTDASLRQYGPLLSNLELLAGHTHLHLSAQTQEYLRKVLLSIKGPFTALEFVKQTPQVDPTLTKSYLWYLVYTGGLWADLLQPLHFGSLLMKGGTQTL